MVDGIRWEGGSVRWLVALDWLGGVSKTWCLPSSFNGFQWRQFFSFSFFLCAGTKKKRNEGEKHQNVEWKEICSEKE
jgi:hypothetical protein